MNEIRIYGIANCDVTRKTLAWFDKHNIEYSFHDHKKMGVSQELLQHWISKAGLQTVMNKRSNTWRGLPASVQEKLVNDDEAIKIMREHTSIIKRPVIECGGDVLVGFDEKAFGILVQIINQSLKQ